MIREDRRRQPHERMKRIKIPSFGCWWKSTTDAVIATVKQQQKKDHATTAAAFAISWRWDDDEEEDAGATSAPPIVLKIDLHCAACARKIKLAVMDVPGLRAQGTLFYGACARTSFGTLLLLAASSPSFVSTLVQVWRRSRPTWLGSPGRRTQWWWRLASMSGRGSRSRSSVTGTQERCLEADRALRRQQEWHVHSGQLQRRAPGRLFKCIPCIISTSITTNEQEK